MRPAYFSSSPAAALAVLLLSFATAHPLDRTEDTACIAGSASVSASVTCGEISAVENCISQYGASSGTLEQCLKEAGCEAGEAHIEAILAVHRCSLTTTGSENNALELRKVVARDTTTSSTTESTATSTSTSATDTATTASTTSTSATATSTAASTASSTTASSTSSGTASTTSSTSTSTSTSTSSSNNTGMTSISYFVAAILGLFVAGCVAGICFSCLQERSKAKKDRLAAEAKEGLLAAH